MKAEERKALETNTLQKGLEQAFEGVTHGPSSTTLFWIGGAALVGLGVLLFLWFSRSAATAASGRWFALDQAAFQPQLDDLLAKPGMKDTTQGRLARFKDARLKMSQGLRDLGGIRHAAALEQVAAATKEYDDLLRVAGRVPLLHQEALSNAAKGHEAQGEYEKARQLYERLAKDHAASALGKEAAKSLKRLDDPQHAKDLADLAKEYGPKTEGRAN